MSLKTKDRDVRRLKNNRRTSRFRGRGAKEKPWFVYMLECRDGALYTGIATDVDDRFAKHCAGRGAAYTRANPPRRVVARLRCSGLSEALKLEYRLKQLARTEKLLWARRPRRLVGPARAARSVSRSRPTPPGRSARRVPRATRSG